MPSAWGDTAKNTRNGKASARWPMTFESNGCRRVAERVNKHAGAWWHGLPANVPGGVHVRPAVGRLRLVERKQARVVDHDRDLGHSVVTRIAKVDKSVELAGTKIGVRHRKPRAPAGKMIWDCAGISDAFNDTLPEPLPRAHQYSSASMIVMTRSVTDGSAGSGEWQVNVFIVVLDLEHDRVPVRIE